MEDVSQLTSLPDDVNELKRLLRARDRIIAEHRRSIAQHKSIITQHQSTITQRESIITQRESTITQHESTIGTLTRQRDEYYLEKLRLEIRLAKALKQAYGPRADRLADPGQLLLDFGGQLDALTIEAGDLPAEAPGGESAGGETQQRRKTRRLRTRGRRDIAELNHLPMIEQTYELTGELCRCPRCQKEREKIGSAISYTIEYLPGSFVRVKHIQHKYACHDCEQDGHNPSIALAAKTNGSPIDKGLPGPGLLAYVVTSKFGDYQPLHRLQHIFARQGFELDRSTMCLWMADVARLVRPIYDRMTQRVLQSHVLATDDTVMPLLSPGKAKSARMWIYQGDAHHPYNVFEFTESRRRDGPARFLKDFRGTLLADAYGGYDGIVLNQALLRAGCWAHARRKFVENEKADPKVARAILRLINQLFEWEAQFQNLDAAARLHRRQTEAMPLLNTLHALLLEHKARLLPKHPLAEAIQYTLNQWHELTLFTTDPAVPIHNNLAEQQMKRIALLRKNALFAGSPHGGETAAILSSLTSTCRRHQIDPQAYLTQLLANLPSISTDRLDDWLPDRWQPSPSEPRDASNESQP